ncbi:MAG: gamma-glutamyltransferase [Saprospiraceae bacterium]
MKFSKGVVAAGHGTTADVAAEILANNGNAYDAAVAALLVSFLSEPCMSSPGGGGFANVFKADGTSHVLDFFCQTPKKKLAAEVCDFFPFTINFGGASEDFYIGHGSHAVPGMIAGIFKLHELHCSMPFADLTSLAIEYARKGVPLDAFQRLDIGLLEEMIGFSKRGIELYKKKDGSLLEKGDNLYMKNLSGFLEMLVHEGKREFYEGEIANRVVEDGLEKGGHLQYADFKDYKVNISQPITVNYKKNSVITPSYPSLGGMVLSMGLAEHSKKEMKPHSHDSYAHLEHILPAIRKMEETVRDPQILSKYLEQYDNVAFNKKWGSTTHLGIVDKWGNAVSITVSNGEGSGYIIPGTDCFMNNMLGEAALLPNGFFSWKEDTRLYSLMSPTIITKDNEVKMVTGTGGAGRIPSMIFQVIQYLLDYGLDLQEAVDASRIHLAEGLLNIEPGMNGDINLPNDLTSKIWDDKAMYFGGVHSIYSEKGGLHAVGDKRRFGEVR